MMKRIITMNLLVIVIFHALFCFGCYGEEMDDADTKEIMNTINKYKEDVQKATGFNRPEDIPEVSDWLTMCEKKVGRRNFRLIKTSPKKMIDCVSNHIKLSKLKMEVNDSMERGELDLVFKKYCGRQEPIMECVDEVLENVKPCLNDQQLKDLEVTREAIDAGIDFICYENGDRIALFMSEDGIQCVQNNTDRIKNCIQTKIPEVKDAEENPKSVKINQFLINEENCKKLSLAHQCIIEATTTCDDPTPSNILDSLITQALKVTPCEHSLDDINSAMSSSSGFFYTHFRAILPHFLTVVAAGLTAAQILL